MEIMFNGNVLQVDDALIKSTTDKELILVHLGNELTVSVMNGIEFVTTPIFKKCEVSCPIGIVIPKGKLIGICLNEAGTDIQLEYDTGLAYCAFNVLDSFFKGLDSKGVFDDYVLKEKYPERMLN